MSVGDGVAERRKLRTWLICAAAALSALAVSAAVAGAARTAVGGARIELPPPIAVATWTADTDNLVPVRGRVSHNGRPVTGARLQVDQFFLPRPTDAEGRFTYLVDATLIGSHAVTVADLAGATIGGVPLTRAEQDAVGKVRGAVRVAYPIVDMKVSRNAAGAPVITGRIIRGGGGSPPLVSVFSYELKGTVRDADGKPVVGARVNTRTLDRDYWTTSTPTDEQGRYTSLFPASSAVEGKRVPFSIKIAFGDLSFEFLAEEYVYFDRLKSARLDIRLPPRGFALALPLPVTYPGALYEGIAVGVVVDGKAVRPASATWPGRDGSFRIVLPKTLSGRSVSLWQAKLHLFSEAVAAAGGPIDFRDWPTRPPADQPSDLRTVKLP
jgi:hypothetical protein